MDGLPGPPIWYWFKPKNWRREIAHLLAIDEWRKYCFQHDVGHWWWHHRHCCAENRAQAQAAHDVVQRMAEKADIPIADHDPEGQK